MPAIAQQDDAQAYAQQQMEQMANEPVTDEQLETFVDAIEHIERINDEFVAALENVETQEEAQQLQMDAQREMVESVEETGLTVEEYNALAYRLQNDPEVQAKVEAIREDREANRY
jgi:predicted house-cleaning noncanonical NTP pyrophosphatase (MazG superfamily)